MAGCGGADGDGGDRRPGFGNPPGTGGTGLGAGGGGTGTAGFNNPGGPQGGQSGTGVQNPTPGGAGGEQCAEAMINTSTSTPTILFVIDGSGSMCEQFGGSTRWQALRSALLDQTQGVIYRMQSQVVFGAMLYDGTIDGVLAILGGGGGSPSPACAGMYLESKMTGECPGLVQVAPALDNATAIDMAFPPTELGGSTPTDRAMKSAVDLMLSMQSTNPDVVNNPLYIILATDGQPNDICMGGMGGNGDVQRAGVIAEVDRAAAANITTFVISLAGNDQGLQAHLDEVARHGDPNNASAQTYSPESPQELANTLAALVGGAIGCEVALNGMVTIGQECRGFVELNGGDLPCCQDSGGGSWTCDGTPAPGEPDGWRLKDERTVELMGAQCLTFLQAAEASLRASFPCDVFSPD